MDYRIAQFLLGLIIGSIVAGLVLNVTKTKEILETLQTLTIISVTLFTAYWTSKTFAHEARSAEAKDITSNINKFEKGIRDLCLASLYDSFGNLGDSQFNQQVITRVKSQYEIALNTYIESITNANYLEPSALAKCLLALPTTTDIDSLMNQKAEQEDVIHKLWEAKREIRDTSYFNLSTEMRRLRRYLGF